MSRLGRNALVFVFVFLAGANMHRLDERLGERLASSTMYMDVASPAHSAGSLRGPPTPVEDTKASYQLAFDESYGFFDDIPQDDWNIHQAWAREQIDHRYDFNPKRHYNNPALWYYNNYNPIFNCPHAKRVWGIGDGPKWVCDPHRLVRQAERRKAAGLPGPHCLIYSVGSNGNYEFEDGMIARIGPICEIHIFDFSNDYDRPENKEKNIHFHRLGLQGSGQNRVRGEFASFPEILKKLGHENRTIDIFKIDCEGCEWDTYKDWIEYDMRQILIETHQLPGDSEVAFDFFDGFKKNNFAMFSKEVNGFGEGKFYEFSYIKLHPDFLNPPNMTVDEVDLNLTDIDLDLTRG